MPETSPEIGILKDELASLEGSVNNENHVYILFDNEEKIAKELATFDEKLMEELL